MRIEELQRGDLILVRWSDASDSKGTLEEHERSPEAICKDWGVYLGATGTRRRFLLVGKDVVEGDREWGATRIPVDLIEGVELIMPRDAVAPRILEVQTLSRRIRLRKHQRGEARLVRVA